MDVDSWRPGTVNAQFPAVLSVRPRPDSDGRDGWEHWVCPRVQLGASLRACPGVYLRTYSEVYLGESWEFTWERRSSRLGVYHREQLGAYSQAGWECAIECNQECTSERTWEREMKCIWQLAFKFVVCSVMYSIQRTQSHAFHSNLVNA